MVYFITIHPKRKGEKMHSQAYHDQLRLRDAIYADPNNDYWFDRGIENFGKLTEIMGEAETDKWFDAQPKPTNWRQISAICTEKIQALELDAQHNKNIETIRVTANNLRAFQDNHPRPEY